MAYFGKRPSKQEELTNMVKSYLFAKSQGDKKATKKANKEFWKRLKQMRGFGTAWLDRDLAQYNLANNDIGEFVKYELGESRNLRPGYKWAIQWVKGRDILYYGEKHNRYWHSAYGDSSPAAKKWDSREEAEKALKNIEFNLQDALDRKNHTLSVVQIKEERTMNEELLDNLMDAVTDGSPLDFAEALDSALKVKCADAIDYRRNELAESLSEEKDEEDDDYEDEDDDKETVEEETDEEESDDDDDDVDVDKDDDDDDDDDDKVEESMYSGSEKDKETFKKWGPVKKGKTIKPDPKKTKVTSRRAG